MGKTPSKPTSKKSSQNSNVPAPPTNGVKTINGKLVCSKCLKPSFYSKKDQAWHTASTCRGSPPATTGIAQGVDVESDVVYEFNERVELYSSASLSLSQANIAQLASPHTQLPTPNQAITSSSIRPPPSSPPSHTTSTSSPSLEAPVRPARCTTTTCAARPRSRSYRASAAKEYDGSATRMRASSASTRTQS